jgi:hypothetical protein
MARGSRRKDESPAFTVKVKKIAGFNRFEREPIGACKVRTMGELAEGAERGP